MNPFSIHIFALAILFSVKFNCQTIYSESFGSSLGTCTAANGSGGNWAWTGSCGQSTTAGHSAPGAANFQGANCNFGNSSNIVSGNLTTPTMNIGPTGAILTFNYFIRNECQSPGNTCTYDVLTFQISNNGGTTWTTVISSSPTVSGLVQTSTWTPVSYALNSYSNQAIMLRFNFNSIDGVDNEYDGIYVDDITVTGNCLINITSLPLNSATVPTICAGSSVTLATSAVSNFSWSNGATTSSIVVSPTVNTVYSIAATSSANCLSFTSLPVIVNSGLPLLSVVSSASLNSGICPNSTVMLTASGANSYVWYGSSVNVTNGVAFSPTSSVSYTVFSANACGTSSSAISVSIHPIPIVNAVASQPTLCSGSPLVLTGTGSALTYTWNGNLANGSTIFPSVSSSHTVIGTSALGCTASAIASVSVVTTPTNSITASPTILCVGASATLSSIGASNYTWTTPSGTQSASLIIVSPVANTIYTLTTANGNCSNTQTMSVNVNALPNVFAIVSPTVICAYKTAILNAVGAQSYSWTSSLNPTFIMMGSSVIVSPSITTIYTVAASDGTCANTTTVLLTTNPIPTISIVATSSNICQNNSVTLTANGAIAYSWTTIGITSNSTSASITETPTTATLYQVTGINSYNCSSNQQQVVLTKTSPTISIATTRPLYCKGAACTLTAASQGGSCTYTWSANAGSTSNSVTTVYPLISTSYTVVGLAVNGCTATQSYPVSVFAPSFAVSGPTTCCVGGTITLTASGASSYTWSGNQASASIQVSPMSNSVYSVSATSFSLGLGCVSTNSIVVNTLNNPIVTAIATQTQVCKGEATSLMASGANTYNWSNNQTGSLISVTLANSIAYTVTGTDQNGCSAISTVQILVDPCTGIEKQSYDSGLVLTVYPNPNSGSFKLTSKGKVSIVIENEIGQVVAIAHLNEENNYTAIVSDFAKGIYYLTCQNITEYSRAKIVVTY